MTLERAGRARHLTAALWAVVLGSASGLACVAVRLLFRVLQWAFLRQTTLLPEAAASLSPLHRAVVPLLGAACATAVVLAAKRWSSSKHFEDYVEAVRLENGRIPFGSTLWRTVSSAFSVATGAAVGREGSMIQFATAVTSWLASHSGVKTATLSRQVAYGAAAAVAAAYQAPLAGVFFALEIVIGEWEWLEVPNLLLAATAGWFVSHHLLGGGGPLFAVAESFTAKGLLWTLPLALILGALGPAYQVMLRSLDWSRKLPAPLLWSGIIVGLLSVFHPAVWGNGDVALLGTLSRAPVISGVAMLLLFRLLATVACIGTGTVGGVFTPTLFAGAALGLLAGHIVHAPQLTLMAVVGLSVFLAGVTHAPWMASFMAAELTGQWHLLPLFVVLNLIAFHIARRISPKSLYGIAGTAPTEAVPAS